MCDITVHVLLPDVPTLVMRFCVRLLHNRGATWPSSPRRHGGDQRGTEGAGCRIQIERAGYRIIDNGCPESAALWRCKFAVLCRTTRSTRRKKASSMHRARGAWRSWFFHAEVTCQRIERYSKLQSYCFDLGFGEVVCVSTVLMMLDKIQKTLEWRRLRVGGEKGSWM